METIDWNGLMAQATAGFDPVPGGDYPCEVVKATATVTANKKPMFEVQFNILAGPHANRKIFNNFVLSQENPNALGFFFRHLAVLGITREVFAATPQPESIAAQMLGKRVILKVVVGEYGGQPKNEVKNVMPPDAATLAAVAPATVPQPGPGAPPAFAPGVPGAFGVPAAPQFGAPAPAFAAPVPQFGAPVPAPQFAPAPAVPGFAPPVPQFGQPGPGQFAPQPVAPAAAPPVDPAYQAYLAQQAAAAAQAPAAPVDPAYAAWQAAQAAQGAPQPTGPAF